MPKHRIALPFVMTLVTLLVGTALFDGLCQETMARPKIRQAFFTVYPDAVGTTIETVPSQLNHCGVCHFDFTGGGQRNAYGVRLGEVIGDFPNTDQGRQDAVLSIQTEDPDTDGFSTYIEVTDVVSFTNTPTFPGLTPANVGSVSQVDLADIQNHLVPSTGGDTTPPDVTVIAPNGGETLTANASTTMEWTATDASGVAGIDLYLSLDNGATFDPLALGLPNTGTYTWFPANRPSTQALILVEAIDNAFNIGQDESDNVFSIESPPGGIVPTTLRDFDQPGSQPLEAGILNPPEACAVCHGNYDSAVEPLFNWQGSMMSQASRDLLMEANMAIANQDAPDSGDLCLRCHLSRGWLLGRSVPTDGSQMLSSDRIGVSCDFCHRLVDPFYATANPNQDLDILAALRFPASDFGNGMATIDPTGARRGPFADADSGHPVLVSPFHREAALCGTCHDVSNPAFRKDGSGNYGPNAFDTTASSFSAHSLGPVERTYSEWFYSEYNTPGGVYAPQFGGNRNYVATCQDCHMRDVTGEGCNQSPPVRDDLPLHDQTGGSTWLPGLLSTLYPGEVDETALQAGIARARYMLQNATELTAVKQGTNLKVTITNNAGHKLPTGYPEGRRIWINVKFYDAAMLLVSESASYNEATGVLSHDPEAKIYEVEPGLDSVTAPLVGVPEGPSFHFVLNNKIFKDNRIPPRGFTNAAFADFGGLPVSYSYPDGQYWDDTLYAIPAGAVSAEVTLYYQSTSKEFVEFLRDKNSTNNKGQEVYDLWNDNGKCPPEIMAQAQAALIDCTDGDGDGHYAFDPVDCPMGDDCDDSEPNANPGAEEVCDGLDNNCVNGVDEEPLASDSCDNGAFCDGEEYCAVGTCQSGTAVDCSDGVGCTVDSCNETTDSCESVPSDAVCDDGLYCNGAETCDALQGCQTGGGDPCTPPLVCDEGIDACVGCAADGDCDDGLYCNGAETCSAGTCQGGTPVDCSDGVSCTVDSCNETSDACDNVPTNSLCDDGLWCNGVETCNPALDCQPGTAVDCNDGNPCTDDSCDEGGDSCENQCNATDPADDCCDSPACAGDPVCVSGCVDNDGDGYGDPADLACDHPELDCNDSNPFVFPGAPEICDGVDNQCPGDAGYGQVDEGCSSSCTGTATASTLGASPVYGPADLGRHMIYFLFPMGAVALLTIRRRKK